MIQINKPDNGPRIPYERGRVGQCKLENASNRLIEKHDDNPNFFSDPARNWRPNQRLYGHQTIKDLLKRDIQHNKCCYCEKEIRSNYTVEHYRPCCGVSQESEADKTKPGYFWLSYQWSNLFYSCHHCNGAKGTLFPLENDLNRASIDLDPGCDNETPSLVDMVRENPRDYIEYVFTEPVGTEDHFEKGELMIKTVGLRSNDMFDERFSHWQKVEKTKNRIQEKINKMHLGQDRDDEITWYQGYLDEKCDPRFPFSSLIACNRDYFELEV